MVLSYEKYCDSCIKRFHLPNSLTFQLDMEIPKGMSYEEFRKKEVAKDLLPEGR